MKIFAAFFCAIALLALPCIQLHAQTFEGTITFNMTLPAMGDEDAHTMISNFKGDKTESEIDLGAMGSVKTYTDPIAKKHYMAMAATHNYFQADLTPDTGSVTLTATGKKDTVAGHVGEEYTFKDGTADCSVFVSKGFPQNLCDCIKAIGADNTAKAALRQLGQKGYFPVNLVISANGEVATTMQFVKYEPKKLDDAVFAIPTDVTFQPMPQMGGMH